MIFSLVILVLIDLLFLGVTLGDVAPPVDVQATHASVAGPVEISWMPPVSSCISCNTSDLLNVTGYRIFFDSGESILLPSIITSISVLTDDITIGQQIAIRSEAEQKHFSELINVTITRSGQSRSNNGSEPNNKAAAIALGIILVFVLGLAGTLATLLLMNRLNKARSTISLSIRRSYYRLRKHFIFKDPNTSENVAYGSVNITPPESTTSTEDYFETLVIAGTEDGSGQDTQPHPTYENVNYSEMVD